MSGPATTTWEERSVAAAARRKTLDRALRHLAEAPRSLPDLAEHLSLSPEHTRRLVAAMLGLGLAQRVGPDVFAAAGPQPPAGAVAPSPKRQLLRGRALEVLAEPCSLWRVAGYCKVEPRLAGRLLGWLVAVGLAVRSSQGTYRRFEAAAAAAAGLHDAILKPRTTPRPQPIRDSILAFLQEPRSAGAVARHIGRTVPVATGHLAAMRRKGLVRRLGYSAYALAAYDGPPLAWDPRRGALLPDLLPGSLAADGGPQPSWGHRGLMPSPEAPPLAAASPTIAADLQREEASRAVP